MCQNWLGSPSLENTGGQFWAYVLINRQAHKRYVGHTDDLERRLDQHNGSSDNPRRFTRRYPGQWELLYSEEFQTRSEAIKREKWLKSGVGRAWLDKRFGPASPPKAD